MANRNRKNQKIDSNTDAAKALPQAVEGAKTLSAIYAERKAGATAEEIGAKRARREAIRRKGAALKAASTRRRVVQTLNKAAALDRIKGGAIIRDAADRLHMIKVPAGKIKKLGLTPATLANSVVATEDGDMQPLTVNKSQPLKFSLGLVRDKRGTVRSRRRRGGGRTVPSANTNYKLKVESISIPDSFTHADVVAFVQSWAVKPIFFQVGTNKQWMEGVLNAT